MRMNKKKEVVPKLRFPEHIGNKLKITKLGEIASAVTEKVGKNIYILMSVTSGVGLVPQAEKFGREIAGDSYKNYIAIKKYDFAYNKSATKQFPEGYISMLEEYNIAAVPNSIFTCFRITDSESYPLFFDYLFQNNYHGHWLRKYIEVGARAHGALSVDTKHLWSMPLALPDFKEQQKIADCLFSIDELIDAESRKLKVLEEYKKGLMQKVFPVEGKILPEWRFPEFRGCGEWGICTVKDSFDIITPPKKIVKSEYKNSGKYPIVDQSQEYIAGWTDDETAIVPYRRPLIIFGDHTCVLKYMSQPFAQGADGIKILSANYNLDEKFAYYCLENIPLNSNGYQRHYSTLKEFIIKFPDRNSGEQQKIADCLSEVDTMITEQSNKVEQLKAYKKGLMQGLFPSLEEADI